MQTAYITYCSAPKRKDPGTLPAIDRYLSVRIASVEELANQEAVGFLILSGTYGLIERTHPLPWYDHLLAVDEIEGMSARARDRLADLGVEHVVWFTVDPAQDPFVSRYAKVIEVATGQLGVSMEVRIVKAED